MLTQQEFTSLEKYLKSKKLTGKQVLLYIKENYVTQTDKVNTRNENSFVHKIESRGIKDETNRREKELGVKVRTRSESEQSDSTRSR